MKSIWKRIEAGLYRSGDYEIVRSSLTFAGKYPWIIFLRGKQIGSVNTMRAAKSRVAKHREG